MLCGDICNESVLGFFKESEEKKGTRYRVPVIVTFFQFLDNVREFFKCPE